MEAIKSVLKDENKSMSVALVMVPHFYISLLNVPDGK